jgi:hypothetical protein
MNATPTRRSLGTEPDPPPGNELAAFLWVVAGLIAVVEVAWWLVGRMYAG